MTRIINQPKPSVFRMIFIVLLLAWGVGLSMVIGQVVQSRKVDLMGSRFEITIVDKDSLLARSRIEEVVAEVTRIENLISEWRSDTQIAMVNNNAGIKPVKVDREVFELTQRALGYSALTQGAFDVSVAALDRIWVFDGSMIEMPNTEIIQKSVQNVGYEHVLLDSAACTLFLQKRGMKIGFGSIGKGYAADRGRELMQSFGVPGGIVNASGDISTWGSMPGGKAWKIGINNPFKPGKILKVLKLRTGAVVTSGSYEKYAQIGSKRYAHIINPKTGYPSEGLTSVTVWGSSVEFANALSTAVMVMGPKDGIALLKKFPAYGYMVMDDNGKVIANRSGKRRR